MDNYSITDCAIPKFNIRTTGASSINHILHKIILLPNDILQITCIKLDNVWNNSILCLTSHPVNTIADASLHSIVKL